MRVIIISAIAAFSLMLSGLAEADYTFDDEPNVAVLVGVLEENGSQKEIQFRVCDTMADCVDELATIVEEKDGECDPRIKMVYIKQAYIDGM